MKAILDFLGRPEHPFSGDDGCDLLEGEGVVLNGERGMDGPDPVFPSQHRHLAGSSQCIQASDFPGDLRDPSEHGGGKGEGRLIGGGHLGSGGWLGKPLAEEG